MVVAADNLWRASVALLAAFEARAQDDGALRGTQFDYDGLGDPDGAAEGDERKDRLPRALASERGNRPPMLVMRLSLLTFTQVPGQGTVAAGSEASGRGSGGGLGPVRRTLQVGLDSQLRYRADVSDSSRPDQVATELPTPTWRLG